MPHMSFKQRHRSRSFLRPVAVSLPIGEMLGRERGDNDGDEGAAQNPRGERRELRAQQMRVSQEPDASGDEEHPEDGEDIVSEASERLWDIADQREIRQEENETDDRTGERKKPDPREDFAGAKTRQNPERFGDQHVASPCNRTPGGSNACRSEHP